MPDIDFPVTTLRSIAEFDVKLSVAIYDFVEDDDQDEKLSDFD
jgi:hypothetical protein